MSELPAPLTPPDVHGRDLGPMPFVSHEIGSNYWWLLLPDRGKIVAISMMELSWQRRPVASLPPGPSEHPELCWWNGKISKKVWKEHGQEIMRPWVKCSDGLLYHSWLAKQANRLISRNRSLIMSPQKWQAVRATVFERDAYTCQYCGSTEGPFHPDHVVPVSAGGSSSVDNLATACARCNLSKHARTPEEWLQ